MVKGMFKDGGVVEGVGSVDGSGEEAYEQTL
jgi:hypothetical protein